MDAELSRHRERFAADPDATASFEWLEEQCFLAGRWKELAELYGQRLAAPSLAEDPAARVRLLLRLGQLLEERIGDADAALEAYRECARLDGTKRAAWQGLRRLYTARGSWAAVLQVAELEVKLLEDPSERAQHFQEMGDIWQQHLGDPDQAEQFYVRARFERDAAAPEVDAQDAEEDAHATLVQTAWISAARGDSTAAVAALREALERDPSSIEAMDMLVTVLDGAERHGEMAELLERRAAIAADSTTRAVVLARLGQVREEQLGDLEGACTAYQRALASDAGNLGAQSALVRIYRLSERWEELRSLLEATSADGPTDQRVPALCQLGALLERQFGDGEAAIAAYEEAIALDPGRDDARAALERLRDVDGASAAQAGDGEEAAGELRAVRVVGVLERKLARLESDGRGDDETAVRVRLRLAELRSATLNDPASAIEVLEPCLESDAALPLVAQRLALLYEHTGRHAPLIELARRAARASADPAERAEWYRRAAETASGIGDATLAVDCYERLLEERPRDRHAEAALLQLHRTRGEAQPLAELLQSELLRASPRDELPLQLELAALLSGTLDAPSAALAHWRRALALDPSQSEVLDRALACAEQTGGAMERLELLEHLTAAATTSEVRAQLLLRRGDLLARDLGWFEEGVESWRRALELDPGQAAARARLAAIGSTEAAPA